MIDDESYEGIYIFLGDAVSDETNKWKTHHKLHEATSKQRELATDRKNTWFLNNMGSLI